MRSATAINQPLTAYNAIQDQYLLRAGVSHPISAIKGLSVTFGPRMEGVPAANLIGNDLGFRRPGFAISAEPGFIYSRGHNMIQASIGKAVYRDRTRSVPDKILGTHGDAAPGCLLYPRIGAGPVRRRWQPGWQPGWQPVGNLPHKNPIRRTLPVCGFS